MDETLIVTFDPLGGQTPFVIVQFRIFAPTLKPVTVELGFDGLLTTPLPEITNHNPDPTNGEFAPSTAELPQIF